MPKTIVTSAFLAVVFYLSFTVMFNTDVCKEDKCTCCCATEETKETSSMSLCCTQLISPAILSCCYSGRSFSDDVYHSLFGNDSYRRLLCDLRTNIFNSHTLTKLSSIICEEQITPVEIVYYIFRPPKV
jgi:hypothetical protein